jgi:uncharacterized damage-inducible protein DinB
MQDYQDLIEGLRRSPDILFNFVRSIPEKKLDVRRGEGFWTIAEHISHLAQVQPMLLQRFERFVDEDHPEFVPFMPSSGEESDTPHRMIIDSALDQFSTYRGTQLLLLESAGPEVWSKTATHPEYDSYSFYILARHTLMHDHWHMYRMEELWLTKDAYLTRL